MALNTRLMKNIKRYCIAIIFYLSSSLFSFSQSSIKLDYAIGLDIRWEIAFKYGYLSNYRIALSAGTRALISKGFLPYAQYTLASFQGGMGSSISVRERYKFNIESIFALGMCFGKTDTTYYVRRQIYTMGLLNPSPIVNPFNVWYGNLASTYVLRLNRLPTPTYEGKYRFSQRIGGGSLGVKAFEAHYYNDGVPYDFFGFGDGKDRFWTGGGFIKVNFKNKFDNGDNYQNVARTLFAGFDRFTGYFSEAFEVANRLNIKKVPYKDTKQAYYNKGRLFTGIELSTLPGFMPHITFIDNDRLDIQNIIHKKRSQPYHQTFHNPTLGIDMYYKYSETNPLNLSKK